MGILFGFRADDIQATVVDQDTSGNATLAVSAPFMADPISDAVNNVRFAFNGSADGGSFQMELRSRAFFKFQIPQAARITVFGHTTFFGVTSATAQSSGFFEPPGTAILIISARMRVRVFDVNKKLVMSVQSREKGLFTTGATDGESNTAIASASILEDFLTITTPGAVLPDDTIHVRMQYSLLAVGAVGAEMVSDFNSDSGAGLNVPMVIVNY